MTDRVGDFDFAVTSFDDAVDTVVNAGRSHTGIPIRLSNAYCVSLASREPEYAAILRGDGVTYPDGAPVAWCLRRLGNPQAQRVRGPSLFTAVLDQGREADLRHFFLGATDDTLDALADEASRRFPGVRIAGRHAPPFGPLTEDFYADAVCRIDSAGADIVWVGMGTPKQDVAAAELAHRTGLAVVGVGAAFDFVAGTVREAPSWIQRSGFEWLYRLAAEPRRLWRRYLVGNSHFAYIAARSLRTNR
ncbi:N-acetylglucosaminyldiphospho-UDP N-acetyl-beta-D-mannosaminyltransferase [Gordonia sp. CNJ-863]|nr:N-acetylglucosaminyldiphospho-UDP N-acetyl-beta-D-mannosaminyltransferase [Gordonia sp. CNJ-863]